MFTGLIEKTGRVETMTLPRDEKASIPVLRIEVDNYAAETGDSIAVNGCCLTVTKAGKDFLEFEVSRETLSCTTLGMLFRGSRVNLERSLRLGDRLGGHLVSGHVDETALICAFDDHSQGRLLTLEMKPGSAGLVIPKGSLAVNGISLTINRIEDLQGGSFRVHLMIIPETMRATNLPEFGKGDPVNIEYDQTGKFILRQSQLTSDS